jgi:hypothetical protein
MSTAAWLQCLYLNWANHRLHGCSQAHRTRCSEAHVVYKRALSCSVLAIVKPEAAPASWVVWTSFLRTSKHH